MNYIIGSLLCAITILGCANKESCGSNAHRVFEVKFPYTFPLGRHPYLDSLELRIGGKTISYDHPNEVICLDITDAPDTIFCRIKSETEYSFVLAKFKDGEVYSVTYNDCQDEFQLNPKVGTDLRVEYRIEVLNLKEGDTLQVSSLYGDEFLITDSSITEWGRITFSANCYNSFKVLQIDKVFNVKKKCEENDSTSCYLEADSTLHLEQILFQQLHNERLDIKYDYDKRALNIKIN